MGWVRTVLRAVYCKQQAAATTSATRLTNKLERLQRWPPLEDLRGVRQRVLR